MNTSDQNRPGDGEWYQVRFGLASRYDILSWSFGEVKRPWTINSRTHRPEKDGLFCERIFGPDKSWECACGKYRGLKYKGMICDRCGVKVAHSRVRRLRMGHIELAAPVVHIWFRGRPNTVLPLLLGIEADALEQVVLYRKNLVTYPGPAARIGVDRGHILSEERVRAFRERFGDEFRHSTGPAAVQELLEGLDLNGLVSALKIAAQGTQDRKRLERVQRQRSAAESLIASSQNLGNVFLTAVPVIPPDLRPLVLLDSGNWATSDLNDLYRRIINRNDRVKKLVDLNYPEVIIHNEKRMLQQAVDALFDNNRCERPVLGSSNRPLKSLTDMISGKHGRFRQDLLGRRVDYSARAVAVPDDTLSDDRCAVPRKILKELLQPFLVRHLKQTGVADTIKSAKTALERDEQLADQCVDAVAGAHHVLVQRGPTYGPDRLRAFRVAVTEDRAVHLPVGAWPLLLPGCNDDNETVTVHLMLSRESDQEAKGMLRPAGGNQGARFSGVLPPGTPYAPQTRDAPPRRRGRSASRSAFSLPASHCTQQRLFQQCHRLRRLRHCRNGLLVRIHGLTRELMALFGEIGFAEDDCGDAGGLEVHRGFLDRLGGAGSRHSAGRVVLWDAGIGVGKTADPPPTREGLSPGGEHRRSNTVCVRSPLTCRSERGVCRACYGGVGCDPFGREGHLGLRTAFALIEPLVVTAHHLLPDERLALARFPWHRPNPPSRDPDEEALDLVDRARALISLFRGLASKATGRLAPARGLVYSVREMKRLRIVDLAVDGGGLVRVNLPRASAPVVVPGQEVRRGQPLCRGKVALAEIVEVRSPRSAAWSFVLRALSLYHALGVDLDPRNVELAAKLFLRFRRVINPGGSSLLPESIVPRETAEAAAHACWRAGDPPPEFRPVYLGSRRMLTFVESPLVRAAYLGTSDVIIGAVVRGEIDELGHPLARAMVGKAPAEVRAPIRSLRGSAAPTA